MWSTAQLTVFFRGQAVVYIGWRKLADSFLPGPTIARAGSPVGQTASLRNVTGTSSESTKHEDRLTDFKRQAGFFGNSGHGTLVPFCPASKDYPGHNVLAHDATHCCQSLAPFVLSRFMNLPVQPLLQRNALAIKRKNDNPYVWSVFPAKRLKLHCRHPNMHRP